MHYVKYIIVGATLISSPALAEDTKAMNYFIRHGGEKATALQAPKASDLIKSQKPQEQNPAPPPSQEQTDAAATDAWERYKKLAAGTYKSPKQDTKKVKTPKRPKIEKPQVKPLTATAAQTKPKKKSTGVKSLLEQYHEAKEKRGSLNTIQINKPTVDNGAPEE